MYKDLSTFHIPPSVQDKSLHPYPPDDNWAMTCPPANSSPCSLFLVAVENKTIQILTFYLFYCNDDISNISPTILLCVLSEKQLKTVMTRIVICFSDDKFCHYLYQNNISSKMLKYECFLCTGFLLKWRPDSVSFTVESFTVVIGPSAVGVVSLGHAGSWTSWTSVNFHITKFYPFLSAPILPLKYYLDNGY